MQFDPSVRRRSLSNFVQFESRQTAIGQCDRSELVTSVPFGGLVTPQVGNMPFGRLVGADLPNELDYSASKIRTYVR